MDSNDLDAFLDGFDEEYFTTSKARELTTTSSHAADIDDILSDPDLNFSSVGTPANVPKASSLSDSSSKKKCPVVYLGSASSSGQICSNMRCSSCDCAVMAFQDRTWAEDIEYLFLRNNYPDKLAQKLKQSKGSRSYCCQCKSVTVKEKVRLTDRPQLKWFCAKH